MRLKYWLMLMLVFIFTQTGLAYAEYGILPLDNQIEKQLFDENNNSSLGILYNTIEIRGNTLIFVLTVNAKNRIEVDNDLEGLRNIALLRVNQLYEMAGSYKRITQVIYYYNGSEFTEKTIEKDKVEYDRIDKDIETMDERERQLVEQAEKWGICDIKEESNAEYPGKMVKNFYKNNELIATEIYGDDYIENPTLIKRIGHIPDGIANEWMYSDVGGHGYAYVEPSKSLFAAIPYKNGKKNGIEKVYSSGHLEYIIPYSNDKINGVVKVYDNYGKLLIRESTYKNGKSNGIERIYDDNGRIKQVQYYMNGKLIKKPR